MLKCSSELEELDITTVDGAMLPALPLNNLQKYRMPKINIVPFLLHLNKVWNEN